MFEHPKVSVINSKTAYSQISYHLNNNFNNLPKYLQNKLQSLNENLSDTYYCAIDVSKLDIDVIKQVIGKEGYYFYLNTNIHNIHFIWHNKEKHIFEFWGCHAQGINDAYYAIQQRIKNKQNINNT